MNVGRYGFVSAGINLPMPICQYHLQFDRQLVGDEQD